MAGDTEVLPPDPARTRQFSLLGVHPLNRRRCVVEVSLRLFGFVPLRVRLPAATGQLTVTDARGTPIGELSLELSATPTRASLPLANRLLCRTIPGGYRLVITLSGIELFDGSAPTHADGTVYAKPLAQPDEETEPAVRWPVCFVVRSIPSAEPSESDVMLLAMRGRLRQPRKSSNVAPLLSFLRPWIRVETAAEFTR